MQGETAVGAGAAGDAQLHTAAARHGQLLPVTGGVDHLVVKTAAPEGGRVEHPRNRHRGKDANQHHSDDQFDEGETSNIGSAVSHGHPLKSLQENRSVKQERDIHFTEVSSIWHGWKNRFQNPFNPYVQLKALAVIY
jgi:hypothetical protein